MADRQLQRILDDSDLRQEVLRRLPDMAPGRAPRVRAIVVGPDESTPEMRDWSQVEEPPGPPSDATEVTTPATALLRAADASNIEAIVRRFGRPSLPIRNDSFEVPASDTWKARLYPTKARLDRAIRSVGRIEVDELGVPHVGTAWMIASDIAVTNRHVALTFGQGNGTGGFSFKTTPIGQPYRVRIDFREEAAQTAPFEVAVTEIIYIAPSTEGAPDIALLRLEAAGVHPLPPALPLLGDDLQRGQVICAIGYPAEDPRNPFDDQARIFQGLFNIKRLAPGEVIGLHDGDVFSHDASTLGGSSGSVIIDVATGHAVGLHFAGLFEQANWALSSKGIKAVIAEHASVRLGAAEVGAEPSVEPLEPPAAASLRRRSGYRADFLGTGARRVPIPALSDSLSSFVSVVNPSRRSPRRFLLDYHHFSIVMHRDRRMAVLTAVNIDGSSIRRVKREGDPWTKDPRIPPESQIGNELYAGNDLDRGHLVRRLDPAWGRFAQAAERDTFFYTNSTPQHATFNQTMWARLEDYLLDHSDTLGFRASVLTGPIFAESDPLYRDVHLPAAYWKVAAMLRPDGGALSVTGYIVSQSDLITGMEFVYGQFKTYQVSLAFIESRTGLDFGDLTDADPLGSQERALPRELLTGRDIIIG